MARAAFARLSEVNTDARDWCVFQYHRPTQSDGIVVGFRRHRSPFIARECTLRGIDPSATYDVTRSVGYEPEPPVRISGGELQKLNLEITEMPGSVVLQYRKLKP